MWNGARTAAAAVLALAGLIPGLAFADDPAYDRARGLFESSDYSTAIDVLHQAAGDGSSRDARTLQLLGRCYLQEGEFRKAAGALESAAALAPADSRIQTWLARAYGRAAENAFPLNALPLAKKSREAFERAVELDPSNRDALGDLFDFYLQAPGVVGGGVERARALLPRMKKHDPVGHELALAQLAEREKKFAEAESRLRRAIAMAPSQQALYIDLARFLARRGRHEESEVAFQQARELSPSTRRVDFARAETYIQHRRNREEARALLREYVACRDLTPDDPPRSEAIRLLRKAEGS